MRLNMRTTIEIGVVLLLVGLSVGSWAGSLEPPGTPASTMLTLEELSLQGGSGTLAFVGTTTQMFNGADGWAAMTKACFNEFPGARVVFASEYLQTINPPDVTEAAWVQSRPIGLSVSTGQQWVLSETGKVGLREDVNCTSWQVTGESGLVVTPTGGIAFFSCDTVRPVACAAPQ